MPQFRYKAMDAAGKTSSGTMEAVNLADLELRLERIGMDLIRAQEQRSSPSRMPGGQVTRRDLIGFCFHMEQLTRAGVPILEGLSDLRDTMDHPRFRHTIAAMIEAIEGGATLSEAMKAFPHVFDHVTVSLIRAGEQTGELPEVFAKLTVSLKWQDEQIERTKRLIRYPAFVSLAVTGAVFFVMTYLVPKLVSFISLMGKELPLHTRVLIAVSGFLADYWYLVLGVPLLLLLLLYYMAQTNESSRLMVDGWKLKLWVVGPLLRKTILARFANYFALMYASGITVLESMRISEDIVGNAAIAQALDKAGQQIADGASISRSFEMAGVFPPLVLRMLRVGENTGALDTAMLNIGYFYSRDVEESVDRLQAAIEPVLTVGLAAILLWVMISVLGPIYDLIATIQI